MGSMSGEANPNASACPSSMAVQRLRGYRDGVIGYVRLVASCDANDAATPRCQGLRGEAIPPWRKARVQGCVFFVGVEPSESTVASHAGQSSSCCSVLQVAKAVAAQQTLPYMYSAAQSHSLQQKQGLSERHHGPRAWRESSSR